LNRRKKETGGRVEVEVEVDRKKLELAIKSCLVAANNLNVKSTLEVYHSSTRIETRPEITTEPE